MTLSDRIAAVQDRVRWRTCYLGDLDGPSGEYPPVDDVVAWVDEPGYVLGEGSTFRVDAPRGTARWAPLTEVFDALEAVAVERETERCLSVVKASIGLCSDPEADDEMREIMDIIRTEAPRAEPGAVSGPDVAEGAEDDSVQRGLAEVRKIAPGAHTVLMRPGTLRALGEAPSVGWKAIPVMGSSEPRVISLGPCYLVRDGCRAMPVYAETIQPVGPAHLRITVTTEPPTDKDTPT